MLMKSKIDTTQYTVSGWELVGYWFKSQLWTKNWKVDW